MDEQEIMDMDYWFSSLTEEEQIEIVKTAWLKARKEEDGCELKYSNK